MSRSGSSDSGHFSVPPDSPCGGAGASPSDSFDYLPPSQHLNHWRDSLGEAAKVAPSFISTAADTLLASSLHGKHVDAGLGPTEREGMTQGEDDLQQNLKGRGVSNKIKSVASERTIIFPEDTRKLKVARALVQCNDPELDLSGEIGAVGRLRCQGKDITLDLKGKIYTARILPCASFAVISVGDKEARVESIMSDFLELKQEGTLYTTESLVEGDVIDGDNPAGITISASQGIGDIDDSDEEALAKAGRVTGSRKGGKAQKAAKGTGKARRKMKRKV